MLLGLALYQKSRRTSFPLHLHLGQASAEISRVELLWQYSTDAAVMLDFTYSFAGSPAPSDLYRKVRLSPGIYDVAIRVTGRRGIEWSTSQRVEVAPDRVIEIDLAAAAPRRPPALPATTR